MLPKILVASGFSRTIAQMNVSDFDFELPESLIAQHPPEKRGGSRLLVLHRDGGIEHTMFSELGRYLVPGDLLVVINSRVLSARLLGHRVMRGDDYDCCFVLYID